MKKFFTFLVAITIISASVYFLRSRDNPAPPNTPLNNSFNEGGPVNQLHPLAVESMRQREYPGSDIIIEQDLGTGSNYKKYIASYRSDGLKIFGLLTVPTDKAPAKGWPVIIFNHGYIPPEEYSTTERYVAYVDNFARNGYVVFKPDFRGHGNSEGRPEGGYYSPAYTVDVLNAVTSIKKLPYVDPSKLGMWGHSMGGNVTLRSMVISSDIKAGVIWAGVVGSYEDLFYNWRRTRGWSPSNRERDAHRPTRQSFVEKYGEPKDNPQFWNSLSPTSYLEDISGPIQLHHGTSDSSVPIEFSEKLNRLLSEKQKITEYYTYEGADHNLSGGSFGQAMQRSVDFFDRYLK